MVSIFNQPGEGTNSKTHTHTDSQTHRHTHTETDTQTDRHANAQTDTQTDTQTHRQANRQTRRRTDTQTHGQTDTETQRHSDTATQRHRDTETERQRHTHTHSHFLALASRTWKHTEGFAYFPVSMLEALRAFGRRFCGATSGKGKPAGSEGNPRNRFWGNSCWAVRQLFILNWNPGTFEGTSDPCCFETYVCSTPKHHTNTCKSLRPETPNDQLALAQNETARANRSFFLSFFCPFTKLPFWGFQVLSHSQYCGWTE